MLGSSVKRPNLLQNPKTDIKADKKQRPILSWEHRFDIALGTAKGLAYLHEECEDRIIHMDLKPQNILLGVDFFPKISDFGMSRRVVRDEQSTVVNPRVLGARVVNRGGHHKEVGGK